MARENDGQTLRGYGSRKKRIKRRRRIVITTLLLLIAAGAAFYLFQLFNRSYDSFEVMSKTEIAGEHTTGYLSYNDAIVKYNRDGAVAIDRNGDLLWNGSFEMKEPIADTCEDYVVVADRNNKLVHIYDKKGAVGSFNTLYDIVKVEVARQGVTAVLMEEGNSYYMNLYDKDGTILVEKTKDVNITGYPLDFSLSKDGKKIVISLISVTQGKLSSIVVFYNFGEVGQSQVDGIVGTLIFDDILIPKVTFLNNDTVGIFKENGFVICSMKEKPESAFEENMDRKIQSILYNEKYTGVVLEADDKNPKQLLLYDLNGSKRLTRTINFNYNTIFLMDEEIIMYDNLSCQIMKTNGRVKFDYTFDSNITAFYPINHLDRYFWVSTNDISEILLVE